MKNDFVRDVSSLSSLGFMPLHLCLCGLCVCVVYHSLSYGTCHYAICGDFDILIIPHGIFNLKITKVMKKEREETLPTCDN